MAGGAINANFFRFERFNKDRSWEPLGTLQCGRAFPPPGDPRVWMDRLLTPDGSVYVIRRTDRVRVNRRWKPPIDTPPRSPSPNSDDDAAAVNNPDAADVAAINDPNRQDPLRIDGGFSRDSEEYMVDDSYLNIYRRLLRDRTLALTGSLHCITTLHKARALGVPINTWLLTVYWDGSYSDDADRIYEFHCTHRISNVIPPVAGGGGG